MGLVQKMGLSSDMIGSDKNSFWHNLLLTNT